MQIAAPHDQRPFDAPLPIREAANFEAAGQDDVVIEARRRLVMGVVVVPKADMEGHGDECSAGDDRA